jgi:hypothetical protein
MRLLCILSLLLTRGLESKNIFVFGDSHASFCFRIYEPHISPDFFNFLYEKNGNSTLYHFKLFPYSGVTMHRVGRDGLRFVDLKNYPIQENDVVIFIYGEVDIRYHIGKQRDLMKRDLNEIINTLVTNYISTITDNKKQFSNLNCIVVSIVPPIAGLAGLPFYGTLHDRIDIHKKLNATLHHFCQQNNLLYLDIVDIYAKADGSLNEQLSDGSVHINHKCNFPIKERLFELLDAHQIN